MSELERPFSPTLGHDGEPCAECGAPLAHDQRYCLNCGRRRAAARIPFLEVLREEHDRQLAAVREGEKVEAEEAAVRPITPQAAAGVVGGLLLLVLIGVLIGAVVRGGGDGTRTAAATPQVLTVGGAASGTQANASQFAGDWPVNKEGWTVQLQTLPKASTQPDAVAQAKTAAQGKGATAVGALDSDSYSSLDPGNYVVYSGVYGQKKQADAALGKLRKGFPGAKVIHVAGGNGSGVSSTGGNPNALSGHLKSAVVDRSQLTQLQNLPPDQYAKQSRKLPDTTILPGTAPKKDNKAPGAGGGGTTIK
jgi:hypothetical protein